MQTNILQKSHPDSRFKIVVQDTYEEECLFNGTMNPQLNMLNSWEDVTILQIMFTPKGDYLVEFVLKEGQNE